MKFDFSRQIFEKPSNVRFDKTPSSGSRVVLCGQTIYGRTDRQNITKLIITFRNFANLPKMLYFIPYFLLGLMCDANATLWAHK